MPGNYTHPTRVTGTVVTQTIYNGDHQNHIDHMEPQYIDDASANLTAMRAVTSAGDVGTENLATSLQDEIRQLRNAILEMRNTTYWYETTLSRIVSNASILVVNLSTGAAEASSTFLDTVQMGAWVVIHILGEYSSGDVDVQIVYHPLTNTTGNVRFNYNIIRFRQGETSSVLFNNEVIISNPVYDTPTVLVLETIGSASLQVGDYIGVFLDRDANHASDTYAGNIRLLATELVYDAYAGRP